MLDNNNLNGIDFGLMNKAQLDSFMQKINDERYKRMFKEVEGLKDEQIKQGETLIIQSKQLDETAEKVRETEDRINVIGFGIHSKKGKILKKTCSSRVHSILGDMSNYNYLLWSSYFYQNIHHDLSNVFEVDTYKNIHINNYEQAKAFALSWRPKESYILDKTQELINKRNNGTLSQIRCMALSCYLEATNGGTFNPF